MLYLDCFDQRSVFDKPIEAFGWTYHDGCSINMSSLYTRLIQEAGRYCECFASDIIYDIESVEKAIENRESCEFVFAFREYGVNSWSMIEHSYPEQLYEYRSIWKLDLAFSDDGEVAAKLYRAEYSRAKHNAKLREEEEKAGE